jgi:hypothetical protein
VPLPDDTWVAIIAAAREVGISETDIQRQSAKRQVKASK